MITAIMILKRKSRSVKEFKKEVEAQEIKLLKVINAWRKKHNMKIITLEDIRKAVEYLKRKEEGNCQHDRYQEALLDQIDDALSTLDRRGQQVDLFKKLSSEDISK